jgi:hypothetical protein
MVRDPIWIRDFSHLISEVDFELPLTIYLKYRAIRSFDEQGKPVISIEETGKYTGKLFRRQYGKRLRDHKRYLIEYLPEEIFKKLYNVPKKDTIYMYSRFYLNFRRKAPRFIKVPSLDIL